MGKYVNGVYVPDEEEYYDALHPKGAAAPTQQQPVVTNPNKTLNKTTPVAEEVNPYADRAAIQAAINQPAQPEPAQPANLFAQQKQAYLASLQAQGKAEVPTVRNVASAVTPMPKERVVKQLPIDQNSDTDGMNAILGNWTSKEDEEKYRKASVARQRIMAVADALRHIGNIYHTTKYAPSQKFNTPVEQERARYQQEKALRDKANERIMTYQMAKQKLDNDQNRWEQQFKYNMAKDAANYELKKNESEARQQRQKALAELDKARLEGLLDKNTYQRLVNQYYPEQAEARVREIESRIAKNNRTGGGGSRSGGSNMPDYDVVTTYERDDEGRVKSAKKTRTVKHSDGTISTSTKTTKPQNKAGENASNAQRRGGAVSNFSINGNKNQQKKGSNVSRFSIKK